MEYPNAPEHSAARARGCESAQTIVISRPKSSSAAIIDVDDHSVSPRDPLRPATRLARAPRRTTCLDLPVLARRSLDDHGRTRWLD
jgi:hypothetical protein